MPRLSRPQIVAAADASRRQTQRLQRELGKSHPDLERVAQCLDGGALVEDVRVPQPSSKRQPQPSPRSALDVALACDAGALVALLWPALRGRGPSLADALEKAGHHGAASCARWLLQADGLPPDPADQLRVLRAAVGRRGMASFVEAMLHAGAGATTVYEGPLDGTICLLHEAFDPDVVRVLLAHGCPRDFQNSRGAPPLGWMIQASGYDTRRTTALECMEAMLQAGCATRLASPPWSALEALAWTQHPPSQWVARLAVLDPQGAQALRPRCASVALGLLDSQVAGSARHIGLRVRWDDFDHRHFADGSRLIRQLLARGIPAPTLLQIHPDRLSEWLEVGIRCPESEVHQAIEQAKREAEDDYNYELGGAGRWGGADLDLLRDTPRLAASHARALAQRLDVSLESPRPTSTQPRM